MNLNPGKWFRHLLLFSLVNLLLSVSLISNAQNAPGSEAQLIKDAAAYFDKADYSNAFPLYSQLLSLYPDNSRYNYRLGACMLFIKSDKEKPIDYIETAIRQKDVDHEAWYYLGRAYHLNYKFDAAIRSYKKFGQVASSSELKKYPVEHMIDMCNNGKNLLKNMQELDVLQKKELNSSDYFTAYDLSVNGGSVIAVPDEFKSKLDKKMGASSVMYLSTDKSKVFFSSYGDNDKNGKDIYEMVRLPDGTFGKPINLGNVINTPYDEDYPFYDEPTHTLYFSSKGHNSMGGYDVFKSVYNEAQLTWSQPVNMDFPINTPDDDILFIADTLNQTAFFASSRSSPQGSLDVYKIKLQPHPPEFVLVKGTTYTDNGSTVAASKITVKDFKSDQVLGVYNTMKDNGGYLMDLPNAGKLVFTVETEGHTTQSAPVILPLETAEVTLKQKIGYEEGTDKLLITNNFEVTSDSDYLLALNYIKQKAQLEVHIDSAGPGIQNGSQTVATASNLNNTNAQNNSSKGADSGTNNSSKSYIPKLGNSSNSITNKQIVQVAADDARQEQETATEMKKDAAKATEFANDKAMEAAELNRQAQELTDSANRLTDPKVKADSLAKANTLRTQANELQKKAVEAYQIAAQDQNDANNKQRQADLSVRYAQRLDSAQKTSNNGKALEKLQAEETNLKKQQEASQPNTVTAADLIRREADNIKLDSVQAAKRSKSIEKQIPQLQQQSQDYVNQAEKTDNSQEKIALLQQAKDLTESKKQKEKQLVESTNRQKELGAEHNNVLAMVDVADNTSTDNSQSANSQQVAENQNLKKEIANYTPANNNQSANSENQNNNNQSANNTNVAANSQNQDNNTNVAANNQNQNQNNNNQSANNTNVAANNQNQANNNQSANNNNVAANTQNQANNNQAANNTNVAANNQNQGNNNQSANNTNVAANNQNQDNSNQSANNTNVAANNQNQANNNQANNSVQVNDTGARQRQANNQLPAIIPANTVFYSNPETRKTGNEGTKLIADAALVSEQADNLRKDAKQEKDPAIANTLYRRADSLDKVSTEEKTKGVSDAATADIGQYQVNRQRLAAWNDTMRGSNSDKITSANLLSQDANVYYDKSVKEKQKAESMPKSFLKQSYLENTKKDAETALLKQQEAENIYLAVNPNLSNVTSTSRTRVSSDSALAFNNSNTNIDNSTASVQNNQNNNNQTNPNNNTTTLGQNNQSNPSNNTTTLGQNNQAQNNQSNSNNNTTTLGQNNQNNNNQSNPNNTTTLGQNNQAQNNPNPNNSNTASVQNNQAQNNQSNPNNNTTTLGQNNQAQNNQSNQNNNTTTLGQNNQAQNSQSNSGNNSSTSIQQARKIDSALSANNPNNSASNTNVAANNNNSTSNQNNQNSNNQSGNNNTTSIQQAKKIDSALSSNNSNNAANNSNVVTNNNSTANNNNSTTDQGNPNNNVNANDTVLPEGVVAAVRALSARTVAPAADLTVTVTIQKPKIGGFAKLEESVPEGFVAQAVDKNGASFTFVDNKVKFVWFSLPNVDKFKVSYILTPSSTVSGRQTITGEFSYLQDENAAKYAMPSTAFFVGNVSATVAANNQNQVNSNQSANNSNVAANNQNQANNNQSANNTNVAANNQNQNSNNQSANNTNVAANNQNQDNNNQSANNTNVAANNQNQNNNNQSANNTNVAANNQNQDNNNQSANNTNIAANNQNQGNNNQSANNTNVAVNNQNQANSNNTSFTSDNSNPNRNVNSTTVSLTADVFEELAVSPYSAAKPIPVDPPMPSGLVYKVQVGAFRNPIRQDLFKGVSPITGEKTAAGLTRYLAGLFKEYKGAKDAQDKIRGLGYRDAFIVAFLNGKRIKLTEAAGAQVENANNQVAVNNNANTNSNQANNNRAANNDATPTNATNANNANNANVAPSTSVKEVKGLFYTIQVGAFQHAVPSGKLYNLSPLFSYNAPNGYIRYNCGIFSSAAKAADAKQSIISRTPARDAFVVAYYNGEKVEVAKADQLLKDGSAVITQNPDLDRIPLGGNNAPIQGNQGQQNTQPTVNNTPVNTNTPPDTTGKGKVIFSVQVGAYTGQIPVAVANNLLKISNQGIQTHKEDNGITAYTVGQYPSYTSADLLKQELIKGGFKEAFIVAFNNGKRISLTEAQQLLNK